MIEAGSELEAIWRNNCLAADLEFRIADDRCEVQSIQIHPEFQDGVILVHLLRVICKRLRNISALTIHSSMHRVNPKSLSLHQKLGFDQLKSERGRVFFEISSDALN